MSVNAPLLSETTPLKGLGLPALNILTVAYDTGCCVAESMILPLILPLITSSFTFAYACTPTERHSRSDSTKTLVINSLILISAAKVRRKIG
jgi:hypothetical protein